MGIPVITNSGVGDVKTIVEKYNSGYVVDEFTAAAFNAVIDKIINVNHFDAAGIRNGADEFYSLDKAVKQYEEIYTTVLT